MCHSCVSRNPGCLVPAPVFLLGKRVWNTFWIPAFAGMTSQAPPHLASHRWPLDGQGRGDLLHSAKVLQALFQHPRKIAMLHRRAF